MPLPPMVGERGRSPCLVLQGSNSREQSPIEMPIPSPHRICICGSCCFIHQRSPLGSRRLQPRVSTFMTLIHCCAAINFYILLRAVDRFTNNYNRFPGLFEDELDEEMSRLKTVAVSILSEMGANGSTLSEDLINEMCRFGGAELHTVAAFIGGVASQEVIKLITKQFIPMSGTFIFNGIDHKSQILVL